MRRPLANSNMLSCVMRFMFTFPNLLYHNQYIYIYIYIYIYMTIIFFNINGINIFTFVAHENGLIILNILNCETKVWLISVLMITKQGLELIIIFQVWLGKTISKVAITKTNQVKEKSLRRRRPQREVFFKTQAS